MGLMAEAIGLIDKVRAKAEGEARRSGSCTFSSSGSGSGSGGAGGGVSSLFLRTGYLRGSATGAGLSFSFGSLGLLSRSSALTVVSGFASVD